MVINAKNIFMAGIGGIGMSALARWFHANGYRVAGYDRTPSALTKELEEEGIRVHYQDDINLVPEEYLDKENTLVVYTPALPSDHAELAWFRENGFEVKKRSEVLGMITAGMPSVAVAGTHGKTTTTSMVAHVLHASGVPCTAFMGGISQNYNSNLLLSTSKDAWVVIEADEYDRSFLRLNPKVVIITTMDPDHLDIYGNEEEFVRTFNEFADKVTSGGSLIFREDLPLVGKEGIATATFGQDQATIKASDVKPDNGWFVFDVITKENTISNIRLQVPGMHNVMNALAAFGAGRAVGISDEKIAEAISTYKGVKRRFEYFFRSEKCIAIDDYAHHPAEIEACLKAVKALYPEKHVTAVFQPHLYSRTRDFMDGFAESLAIADNIILLDIYPAREKPIEGISSGRLLEMINKESKSLSEKGELPEKLAKTDTEIIVMMGAGDIDRLIEPVKNKLEEVYEK